MTTSDIIAELPRLSPAERAAVQAKLDELDEGSAFQTAPAHISGHPALGIWKDRIDLPEEPGDASKVLRDRLMRRTDE